MNSRVMVLKNQITHLTPLNHSSQKIKEVAHRTYPEWCSFCKACQIFERNFKNLEIEVIYILKMFKNLDPEVL
jgi:hypothetical protein